MPLYFLLGTLTSAGQKLLHENHDLVVDSTRDITVEGAEIMGQYAVLGRYDYLMMVEADDNDAVARLSLELGVKTGLHVETPNSKECRDIAPKIAPHPLVLSLSKDLLAERWFDKPVLSKVEGLTMSGQAYFLWPWCWWQPA